MSSMDPEPVVRALKMPGLLNRYLHDICKTEGIRSSGMKKASMQAQIEDKVRRYVRNNDRSGFKKVETEIYKNYRLAYGQDYVQQAARAGPPAPQTQSQHNQQRPANGVNQMATRGYVDYVLNPFWEQKEIIELGRICEIMTAHRNTVEWTISAQRFPELLRLEQDKSMRLMVFCSDNQGPRPLKEVLFPHQAEIKVNGGEVKANLRGLKNKPGTTRPADITEHIRLKPPTYQNRVEFTYALTGKKFFVSLWLCRITSAEELKVIIQNGRKISKETVIRNMVDKSNDDEIQATSMVLSLKCPLSTQRLDVPIRGQNCTHNACFDCLSYLQLQEQAPTWTCPICNGRAEKKDIVVDEYMKDILRNTSKDTEQVTVEPNGKWSTQQAQKSLTPSRNYNRPNANRASASFAADDDDDLIEVTPNGRPTASATPAHLDNDNRSDASSNMIPGLNLPRHTPTPANSILSEYAIAKATGMEPCIPKDLPSNTAQGVKRKQSEPEYIEISSDDDEPPPPKKVATASNGVGNAAGSGAGGGVVGHMNTMPGSNLPPYQMPKYSPPRF